MDRINNISEELIKKILGLRAVAIVGLSKNSGKTSLLNYLIKKIDTSNRIIGVITTGRDGEENDLVHKIEKPSVILPKNVIYSTYRLEASKQSPFLEIVKSTNIDTPFGKIVLAKTLENIETQIIGSPTVKGQVKILNLLKEIGVEHIFIDGSIDRSSILLSDICDGVIYVAGASFSNKIDSIVNNLEKEYYKSKLPVWNTILHNKLTKEFKNGNVIIRYSNDEKFFLDTIFFNENIIKDKLKSSDEISELFINSAFTDNIFNKLFYILEKFKGDIVFSNTFNILLNSSNLRKLLNNCNVYTLKRVSILAFVINSFSDKGEHIDCLELREVIRQKFFPICVIDILEAI